MMYGQTEASSRIACNYIARKEDIGFVGKIVAGGELLGCDNFQPNLLYELIYKGQNVFMGYANSFEDLRSDDLQSRVLHTGDIVLKPT
jgi:long-subunit acyl-CoA synthetase (AMP-forming)